MFDVRPGEGRGLLRAALGHFLLLCGYYLMRPLREAWGIEGGVERLPWLFSGTFLAMTLAVPLWTAFAGRCPRRRLAPRAWRGFAVQLLVFPLLHELGVDRAALGAAFFIWLSVFNLFAVAVFWGAMADAWRSEQGRRLFGVIAGGGGAGALAGPALAAGLVQTLGVPGLLVLAVVFLELAARCIGPLAARIEGGEAPLGGTSLASLAAVPKTPYLRGMALQTLIATGAATFLYLLQARLVAEHALGVEARTVIFARIDLLANAAGLLVQFLGTAAVLTRLGLAVALRLEAVLLGAGYLALAFWQRLDVLAVVQGLRRATHYSIQRPAREVLYTVVAREHKYKAKALIDTFVYRGGDALAAWAFAGLAALGLPFAALSLASLPLLGAWHVVAGRLARRHAELEAARPPDPRPFPTPERAR